MMIPTIPTTIPKIIFPHTIVKHMPTPNAKAPAIPTIAVTTAFPLIFIGCLCANVNHFFTLLGKMFFTPYGKEFFTSLSKQIFTS